MTTKEYVRQLANFLVATKTTMNATDLSNLLNWNNFKTKDGRKYKGKRGTYVLIKSTWKWLEKNKNKTEAQNVAIAFTTPKRKYAYK